MKHLVRFFVIFLITFCINVSKAEEKTLLAYIDMEKVFNESLAGISLRKQLELIHKKNLNEFETIEKDLKKKEDSILSQKNIISEDEYKKKVFLLQKEINNYKEMRNEKISLVSKKKVDGTKKLLKEVNPILADFSKKNNISMILRKKDIVIAKTNLDITIDIIKLINSKVKKINLN
tara:strand:- start:302 stop:832 length:531 start_codon:yes stop_codon:yes gene_type:complete